MTLSLHGISAGYDGSTVLNDVTLDIPEGRVVALLGPNGAGKTTLLRVAGGLLPPTRGTVRVDGHELTSRASDAFVAAGVTLIPEGRSVFPSLTVRENLRLFAPAGQHDAAIDRATSAFPRLGQRLSQPAGTMSGGEQQMLALARALVRPVRTVLLDEVSMGLAPTLVDEIYDALTQLSRAGTSMLIVEQFATKALAIADLVFVLVRGRVVFAGEPDELTDSQLVEQYLGAEVS